MVVAASKGFGAWTTFLLGARETIPAAARAPLGVPVNSASLRGVRIGPDRAVVGLVVKPDGHRYGLAGAGRIGFFN